MNNENQKNGNFFNGFLVGLILGGLIVFFLGTKKGKKILKAISEEGTRVSELLEDESEDEEIEEGIENTYKEDVLGKEVRKEKNNQENATNNINPLPVKIIRTGKRFFKGIRKK